MTAAREAFALPLLFLTVALIGGLRTATQVRLHRPSARSFSGCSSLLR
jgi:hypothetical protein